MEYDRENIVTLTIHSGRVFSSAVHYPLIAGYTIAGEPLYCALLSPSGLDIAIPDGVCLENISIREHNAGESAKLIESSDRLLLVDALRYEPRAYVSNKYYSSREREMDAMDATGPFSWKFHRKLPKIKSRNQASLDETSNRAPKSLLWSEVVIELDEDGSFGHDLNEVADEDDNQEGIELNSEESIGNDLN